MVSGTLPPQGDASAVARLARDIPRDWRPYENEFLSRQLPGGEQLFLTTQHICDCGTVLGAKLWTAERSRRVESHTEAREIEKLRKKGWTESRIGRWQAQRQESRDRRQHKDSTSLATRHAEAQRWVEFCVSFAAARVAPHVGILYHFYAGHVSDERVHLQGTMRHRIADVDIDTILSLQEDYLHLFHP